MDRDIHVYCTHCKHFKLSILLKNGHEKFSCAHSDKCWFWDFEDSRRYSDYILRQTYCFVKEKDYAKLGTK